MIHLIPLNRIDPNPFQPRRAYDEERIVSLAENIRHGRTIRPDTMGLIQVPVARVILPSPGGESAGEDITILNPGHNILPSPSGRGAGGEGITDHLANHPQARIQLAVGHRRRLAFVWLEHHYGDKWSVMPLDLAYLTDLGMLNFAWSENDQRDDLTAIERGVAIEQAIAMGMTTAQIVERWQLSESAISNKRRLLHLPAEVKDLILTRQLPERHARELLPLVQIANAPKEAIKLAKLAVKNNWNANSVADQVSSALRKRTEKINDRLLTFADWGDQTTIPNACVAACQDCPNHRKGHCVRPADYKIKEGLYRDRLLALAAQHTGLPANNDVRPLEPTSVAKQALQSKCARLCLTYSESTWWKSLVVDPQQFPNVHYGCLDGRDCACRDRQEKVADPKRAAYQRWAEGQTRQAREIYDQTVAQIESYFLGLVRDMDDRSLALLVCLAKSTTYQPVECSYEAESLARAMTKVVFGRFHRPNRVGAALVDRSQIYQLCRLNTPIDEVDARLRAISYVIEGARLEGVSPADWQVKAHLERIDEILHAHPGQTELRDRLRDLKKQLENFSQEKDPKGETP